MIKNTLIVLLSLSVIGLSGKILTDTRNNHEIVSTSQNKFKELIRKINTALNIAKMKDPANSNISSTDQQKSADEKHETKKTILLKENIDKGQNDDLATKQLKKQTPEQTAAEILNRTKLKTKEKTNSLTSEDIDTILSILKSAQNNLRKTSFNFNKFHEDGLAEKNNSHPIIIKKKLSTGPGELG